VTESVTSCVGTAFKKRVEERMKVTGRRGRRRKQLLTYLNDAIVTEN